MHILVSLSFQEPIALIIRIHISNIINISFNFSIHNFYLLVSNNPHLGELNLHLHAFRHNLTIFKICDPKNDLRKNATFISAGHEGFETNQDFTSYPSV